uniref:Histone domain-containing protein n=1 Tax=Ascaris lumbricoides TaxID=6252 RepID=A0A0M3I332_ASCLU
MKYKENKNGTNYNSIPTRKLVKQGRKQRDGCHQAFPLLAQPASPQQQTSTRHHPARHSTALRPNLRRFVQALKIAPNYSFMFATIVDSLHRRSVTFLPDM